MTKNPSPVILDRLARALEVQGLKIKRAQLLETAAYAFGYRNSNEFTAAAKSGDINPPSATPIARIDLPDGQSLIVLNDPLANSPYAIDETFVSDIVDKERGETIGVTPYGHLVRLDELTNVILNTITLSPMVSLLDQAARELDGYTADQRDSDLVGQTENAISRIRALALAGNVTDIPALLQFAIENLANLKGEDDLDRHLACAGDALDKALAASRAPMAEGNLAKPLAAALEQIDLEIENRKHGLDPSSWATLQAVSDAGHAALRGHPFTDPSVLPVPRATLETIIGAAAQWAEDVTTGLADGVNDNDEGVEDVETAVESIRSMLDGKAPTRPPVSAQIKPSLPSKIHLAVITHRHGTNAYVAYSEEGLDAQLAEYCRENWNEAAGYGDVPNSTDGMSDTEVVSTYFDTMSNHEGDESYETWFEDLPAVPTVAATTCARCDSPLRPNGRCSDETCPFSDVTQNSPAGWQGHPQAAEKIPAGSYLASKPADWAAQIATVLESGANSDIWYDAHEYGGNDDEDPDRQAEDTIGETQTAMHEAAKILRELNPIRLPDGQVMVDGIIPSIDRIASDREAADGDDMLWITDADGESTDRVTIGMLATLGIPFHQDRGETLPLTEKEYEYLGAGDLLNGHLDLPVRLGFSVLYQGRKWLAPDIEFAWDAQQDDFDNPSAEALRQANAYMAAIADDIAALGGSLHLNEDATDSAHELTVLLPFDLAFESPSFDDWKAALAYLLLTPAEKLSRHQLRIVM